MREHVYGMYGIDESCEGYLMDWKGQTVLYKGNEEISEMEVCGNSGRPHPEFLVTLIRRD
jgi:hypothetical protein